MLQKTLVKVWTGSIANAPAFGKIERMPKQRARETFPCPVCGEDVAVGAPGCKECGSTAETGWSAETEYDGLDLPGATVDEAADSPARIPKWALLLLVAAVAATLLVSMW